MQSELIFEERDTTQNNGDGDGDDDGDGLCLRQQLQRSRKRVDQHITTTLCPVSVECDAG